MPQQVNVFGLILDILSKNRADVLDIGGKLGGIPGIIDLAPDLIRIVRTIVNDMAQAHAAGQDPRRALEDWGA